MGDRLGNMTVSPAVEESFTVAVAPRPATRAQMSGYDQETDTLSVAWRPSPDLAAGA